MRCCQPGVGVAFGVCDAVGVGSGVFVGVAVGVGLGVGVLVGVGDGPPPAATHAPGSQMALPFPVAVGRPRLPALVAGEGGALGIRTAGRVAGVERRAARADVEL